MSSRRRKVDPSKCPLWLYGPQVSDSYTKYSLGGRLWKNTYLTCNNQHSGKITTDYVNRMVSADTVQERDQMFAEVIKELHTSNILEVLLIFSAFINSMGYLIHHNITEKLEQQILHEYYKRLYTETRINILHNPIDIDMFVSPSELLNLKDIKGPRPSNILKIFKTETAVIDAFQLKNKTTFIDKKILNCVATSNTDCTNLFKDIQHPVFKQLAEVISCNCSFFKQKLKKISSANLSTLGNPAHIHNISTNDIADFMNSYTADTITKKNPIVIKQYIDGDNVCEKKTYLSQLFEKTCILLYKPYYSIPKNNTEGELIASANLNDEIARYNCNSYLMLPNLDVFETPILDTHVGNQTNIPVFFVLTSNAGVPEKLYIDPYAGPSVQFFNNVMKELLDHKVFIPTETFFKNERYELNKNFNIDKLECYKRLPDTLKKKEGFKDKMTKHFFMFVGNLMHFAVVNNIELPFKLSRIYIMKLFNLFDFMEKKPANRNKLKIFEKDSLQLQILLISLYLLEKAKSTYVMKIIEILKDPEKLKDPTIVSFLDTDQENFEEGVRMNGYTTLVKDDFPLYNTNTKKLFDNVIEYLYKTALKSYLGDSNDEPIVDNSFKMDPYIESFFKGFSEYKNYKDNKIMPMKIINYHSFGFQEKMSTLRKADIFLSGFGISYEIIKENFLENIIIDTIDTEIRPLTHFNEKGKFMNTYIKSGCAFDNDNDETDIVKRTVLSLVGTKGEKYATQIKYIFYLYRILLDRGKHISKEFIARYNKKFFDIPYNIETTTLHSSMNEEDYHNEFVKLLIKAWTGSPSIGSKQYNIAFYFSGDKLPVTHACFNKMDVENSYASALALYNDLVILATDGSNFGEGFAGGKKKSLKK